MQGNYDEAIKNCRKAIEIDPNFQLAYNCLGKFKSKNKKEINKM